MPDISEKEAKRKLLYQKYLDKSNKAILRAKEYDRRAKVLEQDGFLNRKARNHAFILIASQLIFLALKKEEKTAKTALLVILRSIKEKDHDEHTKIMSILNSASKKPKEKPPRPTDHAV